VPAEGRRPALLTDDRPRLAEETGTSRERLRILTMTEAAVGTTRFWLVIVALTGLISSAVAATLLWLLMTQPVRTTELLSRAF
jgi:hypothetical protein